MRWPFTLTNNEGILFLFFGFISSQVPIGKKKNKNYLLGSYYSRLEVLLPEKLKILINKEQRNINHTPSNPLTHTTPPPPNPHNGLKKRQISRSLPSTPTQENSNDFWFLVKLVSILGSIFQLEY